MRNAQSFAPYLQIVVEEYIYIESAGGVFEAPFSPETLLYPQNSPQERFGREGGADVQNGIVEIVLLDIAERRIFQNRRAFDYRYIRHFAHIVPQMFETPGHISDISSYTQQYMVSVDSLGSADDMGIVSVMYPLPRLRDFSS